MGVNAVPLDSGNDRPAQERLDELRRLMNAQHAAGDKAGCEATIGEFLRQFDEAETTRR